MTNEHPDVGRLMLVGLPDADLSDENKRVLEAVRPGFLVLFTRNIRDAEQIGLLLERVAAFLGYAPVAAVDQEGGRVTRLLHGFTVVPDPRAVAEGGGPAAALRCGEIIGREMASIGITWNFAPAVDVLTNRDNPGVGLRSYGEGVEAVVSHAEAFLRGLRSRGVEGCLKHFPGLGRGAVDPHLDLPTIAASVEELDEVELEPYRRIRARAWMPTHVAVPAYDPSGAPATLSRPILTDLARGKLGFSGVLVADDLMMGGITNGHSLDEALVASLAAGMDILTLCHDPDELIRSFTAFQSRVAEDDELRRRAAESLRRVDAFIEGISHLGSADSRAEASSAPGESTVELRATSREADRAYVLSLARSAIVASGPDDPATAEGPLPVPDLILAPSARGYTPAAEPTDHLPAVAIDLAERLRCRIEPYTATGDVPLDARHLLLFTENAHLSAKMRAWVARTLAAAARRAVSVTVVALGTPYDAHIPGCEHAIRTHGSSGPQAEAIPGYLLDRMGRS